MKKYILILFGLILAISSACYLYKKNALSKDERLTALMKTRFVVKADQKKKNNSLIQLAIFKEFITNKFIVDNPDKYTNIEKLFFSENHPFIIESVETGVHLLNLSAKECSLAWNEEIVAEIKDLGNKYCFGEDNIAYFSTTKQARFILHSLTSYMDIKDEMVRNEYKQRLKAQIKNIAIEDYISSNQG